MENNTPLLTTSLKGPVELLRESWSVYRQTWKPLVGITILPPLLLVMGMVLTYVNSIPVILVGMIFVIAALVTFITMQGALIDAVRKADLDPTQHISIKAQYRIGLKLFGSFVLLLIIQSLANIGSLSLFVIPGIILIVYCAFYLFAFVIDGKKGFSAMVESFLLVRGRWWGVVGRGLVILLIYLVVSIIARGLGYIIVSAFSIIRGTDGYQATFSILSQLAAAVIGPLAVLYMYKLYQSLKETRTEGSTGSAFKKWLVAFMIIGFIVAAIMLLLVAFGRHSY